MFSVIGEVLELTILISFQVLKATWWIILPVVIFLKIQPLWLFKKRVQYATSLDWVLLEIGLPRDVIKTPKAMENVLAGLHGVWSPINTRAKWLKGEFVDQFSLELAGTNGEMHFYIRCLKKQRNFVESKVFSQYPDSEIQEVEDYTENLPHDIPGRDYDLWGADYVLNRSWVYPTQTYIDFEDIEEERRMDPMSQFAELVSKLEEGEHVWMQTTISPVLTEIAGYAQKERDKLIGRRAPESSSLAGELVSVITDAINFLLWGTEPPPKGAAGTAPEASMMRLTPGEQDMIKRLEIKSAKLAYATTIRAMYIARNDVWRSEHIAGINGYFRQFTASNSFRPAMGTFPSSMIMFFKKQRNYAIKKKLFNAYKARMFGVLSAPYILSTEEIATIYHFPGRLVRAPFMPRVPIRTSEPPRGLPT